MWHKLFRSKSAKVAAANGSSSGVHSTDFDTSADGRSATATVAGGMNNNENNSLFNNVATVRKSKNKNKISNPFKRVSLKRNHSSDSCNTVVNVYEQPTPSSSSHSKDSTTSSNSNNNNNNSNINKNKNNYNSTVAEVNDRHLTTFTTFGGGSNCGYSAVNKTATKVSPKRNNTGREKKINILYVDGLAI